MKGFNKYIYDGLVTEFGKCITRRWKGETMAASIIKAKNNLKYQYKKEHKKLPSSKIDLPGKIVMVGLTGLKG